MKISKTIRNKMVKPLRVICCCIMFISLVSSVQATPIELSFSATGFPTSNTNSAPTDPVFGEIVYEAASLGSTIDSLTSISLSAGGHSFTLAETSFDSPFFGDEDLIYGTINGNPVNNFTSDFYLWFDRVAKTPISFAYASSTLSGIWITDDFRSFSLTNQIPEPATMLLFGFGLLGLAGVSRRKK